MYVSEGRTAQAYGCGTIGKAALHKHHIRRINGNICARSNGYAYICPCKGRSIVYPVSHHGHLTPGSKLSYGALLATRQNSGYNLVHTPLVLDENNIWRMDYADMEQKILDKKIHCAILCSPHNPCGRVWERWELEKAMELFKKHDVFVISDEIWSDLILPGHKHIPTQSISEDAKQRTVAMYAPSKTFNLAGLVGSYSVVYNKWLKDRMDKEMSLSHCNGMNVLSMYALIGGYSEEGMQWVDELRSVITGNADFAVNYIREHFQGVTVSRPQGTYMLFVDCAGWLEKHGKTIDELKAMFYDVGVMVQDGRQFQAPTSLRMNLALPLSRVQEAFDRMDKYVFNA